MNLHLLIYQDLPLVLFFKEFDVGKDGMGGENHLSICRTILEVIGQG